MNKLTIQLLNFSQSTSNIWKEKTLADMQNNLKQNVYLTMLTLISLEINSPPSGPKLVSMACSAHSSKKSGTSCSACNKNQFVKFSFKEQYNVTDF